MAIVTGVVLPNNGDRIKVENYNDPINKILAQVNGNLDDSNILSLSGTKLTAGSVPFSALNTAAVTQISVGWNTLAVNPTAITYNGNRSYDLTMPSDQSTILNPGMRLMVNRATAAPTQVASLNGTSQYFSKSAPNATTFTDDFAVSAWVKLSSYGSTGVLSVISRYNGTSGFRFAVEAVTGKVYLIGHNAGSGNYSQVGSYQSVPRDRWVHIAAQLDMSTAGTSPTTSYIMFDGVDVPAIKNGAGTNPTALIQAGNLEVGSENAGINLFPGKIAQAAVFNQKVTQATMRSYISQSLVGNETGLISAYSFNNTLNDLNTVSANNLTNVGTTPINNADSPWGQQANGAISANVDYAIIHKVTAGTITVQVAEGNTLQTAAPTSVAYSNVKSPYGFPTQKSKWRVNTLTLNQESVAIAALSTYYPATGGKLTVPVGEWMIGYNLTVAFASTVGAARSGWFTIRQSTPPFVTGDNTGVGLTTRVLQLASATAAHSLGVANQPISQTSQGTWNSYGGIDVSSGSETWILGTQTPHEMYVDNAYL